jgi:hypothetical protein
MERKMKGDREIITTEPITITLPNGTSVTGLVCMSSVRPGHFWVEYNGRRKTDGRCYREPIWTEGPDREPVRASQRGYMVSIAQTILREMTESDIGTTPIDPST